MTVIQLKQVRKSYGNVEVLHGIDLEVGSGEFCVFVGPSGCGKSTLLRAIAGLDDVTSGIIEIDGEIVNGTTASERGLAMVFQSYALYPHMSVYKNMAFGLENAKLPKAEIDRIVRSTAELLQITDYLDRKPKALSGGQRQRVAIGRAIVRNPKAFLFDEPLSNLDAELRVTMRKELSALHAKIGDTMIYVTHDQVEAMTLADKIVVLRAGVIEQVGAPMDLYRDPDNKFVAGFIGSPAMNFLSGQVVEGMIEVPGLQNSIKMDVTLPTDGTPVELGLRPEDLAIDINGDTHSIEMTESLGGVSYAYLVGASGEKIVVEERGNFRSQAGTIVGLKLDADSARLFDKVTEVRIR